MSKEPTKTWLTQEAADRLSAELAELEGPKRAEIVKRIEAARAEGDLKENGGYHAAKEEQGKMEGRIRQLRHMLEHAIIGTPPTSESGIVGVGMKI
ncbi:MAG: transcription elongation factor GreA, partial [Actinomycetota bacterium]